MQFLDLPDELLAGVFAAAGPEHAKTCAGLSRRCALVVRDEVRYPRAALSEEKVGRVVRRLAGCETFAEARDFFRRYGLAPVDLWRHGYLSAASARARGNKALLGVARQVASLYGPRLEPARANASPQGAYERLWALDVSRALWSACADGDHEAVRWLCSCCAPAQGLMKAVVRSERNLALRLACGSQPAGADATDADHLAVVRYLVETFGLTAEDARSKNNEALRAACKSGRLDVAEYLVETFGLTAMDARSKNNEALHRSCMYGHLDVAKFLVRTFGLTAADARSMQNIAFGSACQNGHLAVVKYLVETFSLTVEDIREAYFAPLKHACMNGHLAVVEYLTETFSSMTVDDRYVGCVALGFFACPNGDLAVVKHLVTAFGLTAEDVRVSSNAPLRHACQKGHLAVAKYLVETFGLTAEDARSMRCGALRSACRNGHLDVVKYLVKTFGLTAEDAPDLLQSVCWYGHLAVVEYLVDAFPARTGAEARLQRYLAFTGALANGHLDVVEILANCPAISEANGYSPEKARVRQLIRDVLCTICREGHLAAGRWLIAFAEKMGIEAKKVAFEISGVGYTPFKAACDGNQLEVAQWIWAPEDQGGLGAAAWLGRDEVGCAFKLACGDGHLAVARWLLSPEVGVEVSRADYSSAFSDACSNGHLEVARWLYAILGGLEAICSPPGCTRPYAWGCFRQACLRGRLGIARWLAAEFGFVPSEALREGLAEDTPFWVPPQPREHEHDPHNPRGEQSQGE